MHEVMRPSFILLSPSLSFLLTDSSLDGRSHLRESHPTVPKRSEATSKSDSPLPFPALVKTTECDVWRSDSVINDAIEDPRLINGPNKRKEKKLAVIDMMMRWINREGRGCRSPLVLRVGGKDEKSFWRASCFFMFFFYELEVKQKQKNPEWKDWMQIFARWKPQSSQNYSYLVYA